MSNIDVLKFRIPAATKSKFDEVAYNLDTNSSVLLRKFVRLAVARPAIAQRLLATRIDSGEGRHKTYVEPV
jgi:hypothetical protein